MYIYRRTGFHFYQYKAQKKLREVLRCFCEPLYLHKNINLYKQMQSNYKEQNYGNSSIEIKLLKLLKNVNDLFNYENNSHELTC